MKQTIHHIVKYAFKTSLESSVTYYTRHGVIEVEHDPDGYNWVKVTEHDSEIEKLNDYIRQAISGKISLAQLNNYTVKV